MMLQWECNPPAESQPHSLVLTINPSLIIKFTLLSDKKTGNQMFGFLYYTQQMWKSALVRADRRNKTDYIKLDWNVFLCILERRKNRIRSFVSQLLDFSSVGMELSKHWEESKHWTIPANVGKMTQCKYIGHIKISLIGSLCLQSHHHEIDLDH